MARNTSQVRPDAQAAAPRTPTFASSRRVPSNARVATSSETVKPTPAIVPAPRTAAQPTGGRSRPCESRVTSSDAPTIPSGLPITKPSRMPSVIGERARALEQARVDCDAGVREREQADDRVARPRVVEGQEPLVAESQR